MHGQIGVDGVVARLAQVSCTGLMVKRMKLNVVEEGFGTSQDIAMM